MKHVFAFLSASFVFVACNDIVPIKPDQSPILDGGEGGSSSSSSSSSTTSSASSTGSGSSSGGLSGDGSGVRLKRYVHTSVDGLVSSVAGLYYDTALAIDCFPRETPIGLRCVPATGYVYGTLFADANCTTKIAFYTKQCSTPKYLWASDQPTCGNSVARMFPLTASASQVAYEGAPQNCNEVSAQVLLSYNLYDILPEVDYTQFAPMTLEHE